MNRHVTSVFGGGGVDARRRLIMLLAATALSVMACGSPRGWTSAVGQVEDRRLLAKSCGDGHVDPWEDCDDGNSHDGDGCSARCTVEDGFACAGYLSVCWIVEAPTIDSPTTHSSALPSRIAVEGTCLPGATVIVRDGAAIFCAASCSAKGAYSCAAPLSPGEHELVAEQERGGGQESPLSPPVLVMVGKRAVSVDIASSANPSSSGQFVMFTATLTPDHAQGTVQFVVNGAGFGQPVAVVNGVATSIATSALPVGAHQVEAQLVGGIAFHDSADTMVQLVTGAPTANGSSDLDPARSLGGRDSTRDRYADGSGESQP